MTDTLRGIAELEEVDFGESFYSRDDALKLLIQVPGLGPPDLCWVQKVCPMQCSSRRAPDPRPVCVLTIATACCSRFPRCPCWFIQIPTILTARTPYYFPLLVSQVPVGSLTGRGGEPRGYYHYALGRDVASSASIAAYFAQICSLVEPPTFFQVCMMSFTSRSHQHEGLRA